MQFPKDLLVKIKFVIISLSSICIIKILLKIMPLESLITKVRKISTILLTPSESEIPKERIHGWYLRLSSALKINSCLTKSLSQKIIFSNFGFNFLVICGVKFDEKLNLDGHAWLSYKDQIIFEKNEDIKKYTESFRV